ncbi:MAG: hypothetical protein MPK36_10670 [Gammaproteobacteria bacterium]|nr:hypothetical protein [Gammaproteobacteria bacterium]
MTSEASNQAHRFLSFSRRMEKLGCIQEDIPTLPPKCVEQLLDVLNSSIEQVCTGEGKTIEFHSTPAGEFWQKFAVKCYDAGIAMKFQGGFRPAQFLCSELGYVMQHKREKSIDALEFLFRTPGMPEGLAEKIKKALESSEYHVDDSRNPISIEWSIVSANTEAGQRAIVAVRNAGLTESEKHLQEIEKKIGARDYRGSIMECNLVLEAIMKVIDPSLEEKSLGDCLKSPKIEKTLDHKVLRVALSQINGLLNEARHASGSEKRDYDKNIAVLVCGLTASFAEYLANKYLESKKT